MKYSLTTFLLVLSLTTSINAQETSTGKTGYKYNNNFDLALSSAGAQSSGALSWVKFHSITKKGRFKLGYGLRFTSQFGKDLNYTTAPAILTSKQTGPQVLFSETFPENIDTLVVPSSQNNALNISVNLQYTIKEKFDIGFNIDAIGVSFGGRTTGKYMAYQSTDKGTQQSAKPTSYNLLLVSDNDIGMLNSELYFRYWFNQRWAIRAGATFLFTEYTTDKKLRLNNDRWRNKSLMGLVGITFSPFR
ncbi:MAG: hypothetical protein QM534_13875 [Sediminibacterium sp.]|nr:hypothetical protein [Sediminibacterium sp.]